MNNEPNRARKNRPREKGPSAAPRTDPINTGVIEAVNENGRIASIQICIRLGPAPAVKMCSCAMRYLLRRYYGCPLAGEQHQWGMGRAGWVRSLALLCLNTLNLTSGGKKHANYPYRPSRPR